MDEQCHPYVDENYSILAINGEAGELAEWHKKVNLRKAPKKLTLEDKKKELGDILFYLVRCAALEGWTLYDVMNANVLKLEERVENGSTIRG